ncbi:MAG: hypothetical protein ACTSVM_00170 [Candidatus Ranarchaeia archaeon]
MGKINTILLPLYSAIFAGIIAYIVNFSLVESIFAQYAGSSLAYQITLMEAPLRLDLSNTVFYASWIITGFGAAWKTKHHFKGLFAPVSGLLAAFILWVLLRSMNSGVLFVTQFTNDLPFFESILVPGALAVAAGGAVGFIVGRIRWVRTKEKVIRIEDPVIKFIDTCPNCKTKAHSNAVYCAICGTEIYKGLGEEAVIAEEQRTVATLI